MRRKDREITDIDDMLAIIDRCEVMRIGLVDGNTPYVVPLNYGYAKSEEGMVDIYFHSAAEGRKLEIIKTNPNACFEVDSVIRMVSDGQACDWGCEFESVIGNGRISVVLDETERVAGMNLIMQKYGFDGKPEYDPRVMTRTALLKLSVHQMTGKRNQNK